MRTAIMIGLLAIAFAINGDVISGDNIIFISAVTSFMMFMDVVDFFKKITK